MMKNGVNECWMSVAVALLMAGCAGVRGPSQATLIAHRGESVDAPENTLPAYRTAVDRGFGFECDIYLSRDGQLFTFHDTSLTRTTGGANTNRCVNVSWSETLSKVNVGGWGKWKGSSFDPTRPALFSEVLDLARDGRWIYVEVKGNDPSWVPYVKAELERSAKANAGNVLFISFGDQVCAELKRQLPAYRVYWLTSCTKKGPDGKRTVHAASEVLAKLREIGVDGVDISYDQRIVDAAYVRQFHDAGFAFHVWTVDDPARAKAAFASGAETVTTNRAKFIWESL